MIRYTSKRGTTFQFDPLDEDCLYIISAGSEDQAEPMTVHLEDLREFLDYLELQHGTEQDADVAAVGPD